HALPRHLVGPGPRLAGGLVGAVEVDHQPALGGVLEDGLVEVDHLPRLVVEEVDLEAGDAQVAEVHEEPAALVGVAVVPAVQPAPDADPALPGVLDEVAQLGLAPVPPLALDHVVLEAQLAGQPRELPEPGRPALAAVEISPDRPAGPEPRR